MTSIFEILRCPISGEQLQNASVETSEGVRAAYLSIQAPFDALGGWIQNKSGTHFYPVFDEVIILVPALASHGKGGRLESFEPRTMVINPFRQSECTDLHGYEDCHKLFTFKTEQFCSHTKPEDEVIVEFMSSHAVTLKKLPQKSSGVKVAVDLDFHALRGVRDANIVKVCADVTDQIFLPGSIDFALSNSVHHIPLDTTLFYQNVREALKPGARFVGIESNGTLARLAFWIVTLFPKALMPSVFKVIYSERDLMKDWLATSISEKLRAAHINEFEKKQTLFHVVYSFPAAMAKSPRHA